MRKVTIANMDIELTTIESSFLNKRIYEYENNSFKQGDMILKAIACDEIRKPKGDLIKIINTANIVRIGNNQFCRYITDKENGKIVQAIYYNHDYSDVDIYLTKTRRYMNLSLMDFEYILTGMAYSDRLIALGGAVLHGSSIAIENQGIVFSGNSGIGKSTHTSLWRKRFGDKVTIVNDDKPAIKFYGDTPFIFGTPWSGKTELNTNVQVPLVAIVFIKRSDHNRIERLNVKDCILNLISQIARPYYDECIGEKTLDIIEKLVANVPIYCLHCNISQEAVDVVYNALIKRRKNK